MDHMEKIFANPISGSDLFFCDLSAEITPSLNNYDKPLGSMLNNKYEMLHLEYTKRKIVNYKNTSIENEDNRLIF